ncbi:MAG: DNA polymerase III subunit gamma/tau [Gammaproteobacteria bacterium]|nr:DNA polymerase III subunit gamma/tau [Gammaproteobacteria bacterium]
MSYQVLARKWRPRNFKDMIGQEPILRMLSNALEQNRIHHAYLFTGTRGVGKTTLARILAKCLNCETGVTASPCGTCHTCQAIDAGQFLDLFEIDAASRTKVEDTRELLDNVLYQPTQGRYKIYLIDEVHMLSNHSFNALLKTLEEPPEYVKFLLATTDPKRLPITVLSRCLQFHLKRIPVEQISRHLMHICITEQITHEINALEKLAKAADGSMRDAISLLDQAIAFGHGSVKNDDINAMLGCIGQNDLLPLLEALAAKDAKTLFAIVANLAEHTPDFQQVLEELIGLLHHLALAQVVPEVRTIDNTLVLLAKRFTPEDIQLYYQIALLGKRDLPLTPTPQQGFEMTMLRMLAFTPQVIASTHPIKPIHSLSNDNTPASTPPKPTIQLETPAPISDLPDWRHLLPQLKLSGMAQALASNCVLEKINENKIQLALSANHQPMLNAKLKDRIAEALSQHFNKSMQLEIVITSAELMTPSRQQQDEKEKHLAEATHSILQHPGVKQLVEMYDATVEVSLL